MATFDRIQEGHAGAQPFADLFHQQVLLLAAHFLEFGRPGFVFRDPLPRQFAVLYLAVSMSFMTLRVSALTICGPAM